MRESEFRALVSLLDDEDERVVSQVQGKILSLGETIIPKLESLWEDSSLEEDMQDKIADIIQQILGDSLEQQLKEWKESGAKDLLSAWKIISKIQYPSADFELYEASINRMVNLTWLGTHAGMNQADRLLAINRVLFDIDRYKPNRKQLNDPDNYFLNTLIDKKIGNPLTLSMLYLVLTQRLELPVQGIVLPNYYVALIYREGGQQFFIDSFNRGAFFTQKDLEDYLRESNLPNQEESLLPVSNIRLIQLLLRALMNIYEPKKGQEKYLLFRRLAQILNENQTES